MVLSDNKIHSTEQDLLLAAEWESIFYENNATDLNCV